MPGADRGLTVGPAVDARPARRPGPVVLEGHCGRVERLAPRHAAALWRTVHGHDGLWTYMRDGPFADEASFAAWIGERARFDDPLTYAVVDPQGYALGIATLMEVRPEMRVIEVGTILYGPALQGTALATEAQYLLARYVFETLGYRRLEWKCDALNARSRRAALRLGFAFEGIFRQHMIVKGRNRDTAWHAMLDGDWPARKLAFERWLAPDNFDAAGRQRTRLNGFSGPAS
jgi:RimJ/RimL family protein N-acetyltransferase